MAMLAILTMHMQRLPRANLELHWCKPESSSSQRSEIGGVDSPGPQADSRGEFDDYQIQVVTTWTLAGRIFNDSHPATAGPTLASLGVGARQPRLLRIELGEPPGCCRFPASFSSAWHLTPNNLSAAYCSQGVTVSATIELTQSPELSARFSKGRAHARLRWLSMTSDAMQSLNQPWKLHQKPDGTGVGQPPLRFSGPSRSPGLQATAPHTTRPWRPASGPGSCLAALAPPPNGLQPPRRPPSKFGCL